MATTTKRKPQQPGIKQLRVMMRRLIKNIDKLVDSAQLLSIDGCLLYETILSLDTRGGENKPKRRRKVTKR